MKFFSKSNRVLILILVLVLLLELTQFQSFALENPTAGKQSNSDVMLLGEDAPATDLTMNNHKIVWTGGTNKTTISQDGSSVQTTPTSNSTAQLKAKVYFSVGGNEGVNAGDAVIRIPRYVIKDRDNKPIGSVSLSIPKAPKTGGVTSFNYDFDDNGTPNDLSDDTIVIKNYEAIGKGGFIMEADLIWQYEPTSVANGFEQDDIKADFSVTGKGSGVVQTIQSDPLSVRVNTFVKEATAKKEQKAKRDSWQSSWGPAPENSSDYFYVVWKLMCNIPSGSTSPYSVKFEEIPSDGGKVVACSDTYSYSYSLSEPAGFSRITEEELKEQVVLEAKTNSQIQSAEARYIAKDVVLAYPKSMVANAGTPTIENQFKAIVIPPEGEIQQKIGIGKYTYQHIMSEVDYDGDEFSMYKRAYKNYTQLSSFRNYQVKGAGTLLKAGISAGSSWSIGVKNYGWSRTAVSDGQGGLTYGQKSYETILRDGMMYVGGERLLPGDYEITKFYPAQYDSFTQLSNDEVGVYLGTSTEYDKYEPIDVYIKKDGGQWEKAGKIEKTAEKKYKWTGADGTVKDCQNESAAVDLPKGTSDIKFVHSGKDYGVEYRMNLFYKLNPTEHLMSLIGEQTSFDLININEAWAEQDDDVYITGDKLSNSTTPTIKADVENCDTQDYGSADAVCHDYSTHTFTSVNPSVSFSKSMLKPINDADNGRAKIPVTLSWDQYINYSTLGITLEEAASSQVIDESREALFYDLLPKGVTVDLKSIKATTYSKKSIDTDRMPDCDYTVELKENWRNSGRTMMITKVMAPEGYRNFDNSKTYLDTGFKLSFNMIDTWDNMEANGTGLTNDAAFYSLDGGFPRGEADTGGKYEKDLFYDLDGDGNQNPDALKNCSYAQKSIDADVPRAAQMGFTKKVKGSGDLSYDSKTTIPLTGEYSYQLRFALEDKAKAKDVVMYDILETAYGDENHWCGSFRGVDTSQIESAYPDVDVQIYYSTSKDFAEARKNLDTVAEYFDLSNNQLWTKGRPNQDVYEEVTAIAIDLSKNKAGESYQFEGKMATNAQIYMKAPSNQEYLDQEDTPDVDESVLGKNKAYIKKDGLAQEGSNTTKVTLKMPDAELTKSSNPSSGTANDPKVVQAGNQIEYTLKASNKNLADSMEEVVVEDTIPEDLYIDATNIKFYFGSQKENAALADGTGRVSVKVDGQKVTFTIDKLAAHESVNLLIPTTVKATANRGVDIVNGGTITKFNGAEWNFESNKTYHKTQMKTTTVRVSKVWDDNNDEYGQRRDVTVRLFADGSAVEGKTLTLTAAGGWLGSFTGIPMYKADGVTPVRYTVEEVTVPGYLPSYSNLNGTLIVTNTPQVVDKEKEATFKIKKLRKDSEIVVPGVKFELYKGTNKISESVTDESGYANFTVQPEGTDDFTLYLKEVSAPNGYKVNSTPIGVNFQRQEEHQHDLEGNQIVTSHYWAASVEGQNWDSQTGTLTLSNEYEPTPVELNIPITKVVNGAQRPEEKRFEFNLSKVGDSPMPEAGGEQIFIDGSSTPQLSSFGKIKFTEPGTYEYNVVEKKGTDKGYAYDETKHTVTVTITDEDGDLKQSWKADGNTVDAVAFVNVYAPIETTLPLPVKKTIAGNPRPAGEKKDFTFTMTGLQGAPMPEDTGNTVVINDEGQSNFGNITFTKAGTYSYVISEVAGNEAGYQYDEQQHTITATVVDRDGQLEVSWTSDKAQEDTDGQGNGETVTFTNTYTPEEAHLQIPVKKKITGNERPEQWKKDFTFTLTGLDDAPMPIGEGNVVTINDEGQANFGDIVFAKAGVYNYTIKEIAQNYPRYTFDTRVRNITVTVTDTKGKLNTVWKVDGEDADTVEITNKYEPEKTKLSIPVTKVVGGEPVPEDHQETFSFELIGKGLSPMPDGDGNTVSIQCSDMQGVSGNFGEITFTQAGTFLYEVKETKGDKRGYVYDLSTKLVTVTVVDNNGYLSASWQSNQQDTNKVLYENDYEPKAAIIEFPIEKIISGNDRNEKYKKSFKFKLTPVTEGAPMPFSDETIIVDSGTGTIGQIAVKSAKTYEYEISEVNEGYNGYTFDSTVCNITVEAHDDKGQIVAAISYKKNGETVEKATFTNKYDPKEVKVSLPVSKMVSGSPRPTEKTFTFTLEGEGDAPMPEAGGEKTTVKGGNDGETLSNKFGNITFHEAGIYSYTVKEDLTPAERGYTYDTSTYQAIVTVEDKDGVLEANVEYTKDQKTLDSMKFSNTYKPEAAVLEIPVTKIITGNDRSEDYLKEFTFSITPLNGAPGPQTSSEVSITDQGDGTFDPITFEEAGTYLYQVKEIAKTDKGYEYDPATYIVTVEVIDSNGKLYASYTADSESGQLEFTNTYKPDSVDLVIPVEKRITGNQRVDRFKKDFTFTLTTEDGAPIPNDGENQIVINDAGTKAFDTITFEKAGIYYYQVAEAGGNEEGYEYDGTPCSIVVTVVDEDGRLTASALCQKGGVEISKPTFTNTYKPQPVSMGIPFSKVINGNEQPTAKEFTFCQYDANGDLVDTKTITGSGDGKFNDINYEAAGTYTYTVAELEGTSHGYSYDTANRVAVVTVTDTDGILSAALKVDNVDAEKVIFTNTYGPDETSVTLPVQKKITGNERKEEFIKEFTFTLEPKDDAPMPSGDGNVVTVSDEGSGNFGIIRYTKAGEYFYTISEEQGTEQGYIYDSTVYDVKVKVIDDEGVLKATWFVGEAEKATATFTNKYEPKKANVSLQLEKKVLGHNPPKDGAFKFELKKDSQVIDTVSIKGPGQISFKELSFDAAGTYLFTVSEVNGKKDEYTYDNSIYTVEIVVSDECGELKALTTITKEKKACDKIVFENEYNDTLSAVGTGDDTKIIPWIIGMAIAIVVILVIVVLENRNKKNKMK